MASAPSRSGRDIEPLAFYRDAVSAFALTLLDELAVRIES